MLLILKGSPSVTTDIPGSRVAFNSEPFIVPGSKYSADFVKFKQLHP